MVRHDLKSLVETYERIKALLFPSFGPISFEYSGNDGGVRFKVYLTAIDPPEITEEELRKLAEWLAEVGILRNQEGDADEVSAPKRQTLKTSGHPKRYRLVEPGRFEWDEESGRYTYNLDGKSKVGKYLPLFRFRSTILGFHDSDEYAVMVVGKSGRQKIDENIALAQVRTLIQEIEANEVEPNEVEVYEAYIEGVKHRMRPLARDMFDQLIQSYRAWKNRHGGGGD